MPIKDAELRLTAVDATRQAFESVKRSLGGMQGSINAARSAFVGLFGATVGAAGFGALIKNSISAAAQLDDLAEKTGASVEELSKLSQVARIGGIDIATVEQSLIRLAKAIAGADDEAKGAGAAFAALGLRAEELRGKDTAEAMRIVAESLNKFKDGADKTALSLALLGKSGAEALPFLKDLAETSGINAQVTAQQAAQAELLEKSLGRLKLEFSNAAQALSLDFLPPLLRTVEQFSEGTKAAGGFLNAIRLFGTLNPFKSAGDNLKTLRSELEELEALKASGKPALAFSGGLLDPQGGLDKQIADTKKRIEFSKVLQRQSALELTEGVSGRLDPRDTGPTRKLELAFKSTVEKVKATVKKEAKAFDFVGEVFGGAASDLENKFGPALREVQSILANTASGAAAETERTLELIRKEFEAGRVSGEKYIEVLEKLKPIPEIVGEASEEFERLNQLLGATPTAQLEQTRKDMELLIEAMGQGFDEVKIGEAMHGLLDPIEDTKESLKDLKSAFEGFGRDSSRALVDFAFTGEHAIKKLIEGMLREFAELAVFRTIFEPLFGSFSNALSGGFGGGAAMANLIPPFAAGGFTSGGRPILVGERGPEIFVPRSSGQVVPNSAMGGAPVTVNLGGIHISGNGAQTARGSGNMAELGRLVKSAVSQEIMRQQRPGGVLA